MILQMQFFGTVFSTRKGIHLIHINTFNKLFFVLNHCRRNPTHWTIFFYLRWVCLCTDSSYFFILQLTHLWILIIKVNSMNEIFEIFDVCKKNEKNLRKDWWYLMFVNVYEFNRLIKDGYIVWFIDDFIGWFKLLTGVLI